MNKLNILIGGGKLNNLPSLESSSRWFSMRSMRIANRLFCAILICLGMLSCAKPLPDEFDEDARGIENINDIEEESEESEDTFSVNVGIQGAEWNYPENWEFDWP